MKWALIERGNGEEGERESEREREYVCECVYMCASV